MKILLRYLKHYKLESIVGPLFKLIETVFELLVPLVVARIIDVGIAQRDIPYIVRYILVLVVFGVVGLACALVAQYFAAKAAVGVSARIKRGLFAHIQTLSYTELDSLGTSTMITRLTGDVNQIQSGINLALRLLLRSPFVVFGSMAMAFTVDVKSALVFAVLIPLLCVVVFSIMMAGIPLYEKVRRRLDTVLRTTRENLTGVRVMRAFCRENEEIESFREENEALTKLQKYAGRISVLMNPLTYVLLNLAVLALLWIGALQVDSGILSQGEVFALYNYMSQILVELVKLATTLITLTKAVACANRIQAVFDLKPSQQDGVLPEKREETDVAVCFRNVSLTYHGAGDASLEHLDLTVKKGETVGIIGGTGSGKTSLVHLIPRFYDATEGQVLVDGVDVLSYPLNVLRDKIGIVPQKATLFAGTVRENLRWGNQNADDDAILDALRIAQGLEIVEQKEEGLDFRIAQGGKNLSGGQRQRLTIARALVRKPEILILDDSASALDFATDARLRKALRELPDAPTVFLVSQRAANVRFADRIFVLDDGRLAGSGTHDELMQTCDVYREIVESQMSREESV